MNVREEVMACGNLEFCNTMVSGERWPLKYDDSQKNIPSIEPEPQESQRTTSKTSRLSVSHVTVHCHRKGPTHIAQSRNPTTDPALKWFLMKMFDFNHRPIHLIPNCIFLPSQI